jgi:hypothetical protein
MYLLTAVSFLFQIRVVNLHDLNIKNFGHFEEYGSGLHRHSSLEMTFNGQPLHVARWPDKVCQYLISIFLQKYTWQKSYKHCNSVF